MAKTNRQESRTPEEVYQKVFKDVSKYWTPTKTISTEVRTSSLTVPCASSLYRESKKALIGDAKVPDGPLDKFIKQVSEWNRERLIGDIDVYYPDTTEIERLAVVQHLGGATNLVDFSEDLNVALFFACYKNPDKNGRIIVMPSPKKDRESTSMKNGSTNLDNLNENRVFIPRRVGNDPGYQRARTQKGLMVDCPEGYIKEGKYKTIGIISRDKLPILEYLRKYHGIDYQTIFYDIHGYIELTKYRQARMQEFVAASRGRRYEVAEKIISELINMGGTYWEYDTRGAFYFNWGKYEKAIKDFDQAIELNSQYSESYHNRGTTYSLQGNHDQAVTDFSQAIKINPELSEAYVGRGNAYRSQGNLTKAIADYTKAIRINSEYSEAYYYRGLVHVAENNPNRDIERAKKDYLRAVDLDPLCGTLEFRKPFEKYL